MTICQNQIIKNVDPKTDTKLPEDPFRLPNDVLLEMYDTVVDIRKLINEELENICV